MTSFLDWLSANPAPALFVGVAANLFVVLAVLALLQGRHVTFWPPGIGPRPEVAQRVLMGDVQPRLPANFWDGSYPDGRDIDVHVAFDPPFTRIPAVVVGLQVLDAGIGICRVRVEARKVTPQGFDLRFATWRDSRLWNVSAGWVAVGE